MLTVPEAARRAGKNPETIRRWIREGKLPARKIGTQHVLEEADLEAVLQRGADTLELPPSRQKTFWGGPTPDFVAAMTDITLTTDQLRRVRAEARRRNVSIDVVVGDAVDKALPASPKESRARFERMISSVGRFESGTGDVSARHDDIAGEAAW